MIDLIAFDADDTLWHNERLYAEAIGHFKQLLAPYGAPEHVEQTLHQTEMRNLQSYGYGIKGFALSMIEAAIELSQGRIQAAQLQRVIELAKAMQAADVQLVEHAQETVAQLAGLYPLLLITKGDLLDQEVKIARSGLQPYFQYVEIVSDKTRECYAAILARHVVSPARFLMVGNSLRSDILPVVALGGRAVYVPHPLTWVHERVPLPPDAPGQYFELEHLGLLPVLIEKLERDGG